MIGGEETYEQIYTKIKNKIEQITYKTPEKIAETFYAFVKKNPQYTPSTYMGVREYIIGMSFQSQMRSGIKNMYSIKISGTDLTSVLNDIVNHFIHYHSDSDSSVHNTPRTFKV